jgi:protein KRI1
MSNTSKKLLELAMASSSEDEEDTDNKQGFKINENFAQVFNKYREKEEYQKLKDKYGEEAANSKLGYDEEDSSSSDEEEDDDAKDWTEDTDKDFFKTLANLKRKDAKIYDGQTTFFSEVIGGDKTAEQPKKKEDKPMTLVDLERKVITENDGQFEELEDEELAKKSKSKTYVQEMEDIQNKLKKATEDSEEDESDADDLMIKKPKTKEDVSKDEEDYCKWLSGQNDSLKDTETEQELKNLREFWNKKDLDDGEKFLRDYILNKKYLQHDSDEAGEDLSEDEKTLEQQEEFEHKYNFRFEEPDQDFIKRYPRTIQDSMRRKDESRKNKRDEVKERKEREKDIKREELKQLKSLKRKEILEKLEKLRKITGNEDLAFNDEDLEEDFDPDKYDARMNAVFDQYDNAPIVEGEVMEKPDFSDLDSDLEVENWDEWAGGK